MMVRFCAQLQSSAAPTGLRGVLGPAFPALKRWANIPSAYGAKRCAPLKSSTILHAIALTPKAISRLRAVPGALHHAQKAYPRPNRVAILVRHDARDLMQVR